MNAVRLPARSATIGYDDVCHWTPLVLLHAFPLDRGLWAPQVAALAADARVLAPDLPGFGRSSAGSDPLTIDGMADTVAEFLDAVGVTDPVVVGGLSMGGYVAMAFARRHPHRLAGLVLADTKADPDDAAAKAKRDETIALAREKGAAAVLEGMLPKLLSDETRAKRPEVVRCVRELGSRQSAAGVAAALAALRDRPDANPGLAAVRVPTLVIVGEHDAVTPPTAAAKIAAAVRGGRLVTIPGAGHLSSLENPDAFNAAVRSFLTQV